MVSNGQITNQNFPTQSVSQNPVTTIYGLIETPVFRNYDVGVQVFGFFGSKPDPSQGGGLSLIIVVRRLINDFRCGLGSTWSRRCFRSFVDWSGESPDKNIFFLLRTFCWFMGNKPTQIKGSSHYVYRTGHPWVSRRFLIRLPPPT